MKKREQLYFQLWCNGKSTEELLRDIQHSEIFATINNSDLDDQDLISKSKSLGLNILDVKKLNLK